MSSLLKIDPESELNFQLSSTEATPKCTMTLSHAGGTTEAVAFKVKTTQPRRYLVRPNQGLVLPGQSETISILLVEKDKAVLMQSYERLGQAGLDHSKDKFLVQSTTVDKEFAAKKNNGGDATAMYDALTSMWNSVTSSGGGSSAQLQNKKLHVKHTVVASGGSGSAPASSTPRSSGGGGHQPKLEKMTHSNTKDMTPDQLKSELTHLRRKYDELVTFSVNLTAERDILSNTLEQTKRDYNREMQARQALQNKSGGGGGSMKSAAGGGGAGGSSFGATMKLIVVSGLLFVAGVKIGDSGYAPHLPVIGNFFVEEGGGIPIAPPEITSDEEQPPSSPTPEKEL
mmetsp:Transcript_51718/g.124824  ORF Transcript_51718/g.124824 Transcript_51718/m.124824 type:complete len:342 (+) Transcript_51718:101-1126(+)|eukprot:CAMPEP_0113460644 /NCGR_PEP_ID=MMETSP0014_2-20120614/11103_1 /TAXON_ID=2857 /ORGANISM="Nitzschia sp." /LENGTH=341 /DNA_ID=CAMNT_0000352323 /DNA_START=353 /DNA_END=1378 /DNA_ORIENTATION=+ /assembly_acc=CAM_ASM_000159